jgi:AcrR family transcriptional regulator
MTPRPRRSQQATNLQETIKETAWKQIAEFGAAALSLRAIAREIGITAPAIYNYYMDRDALVTALIIDAYLSFGDAQLVARDGVPQEDLPGRLMATGMAYRNWALTHPQRYQLIFGAPIPGYTAPLERVLPVAARSLSALVSVIDGLRATGKLQAENFPEVKGEFKTDFEMWKRFGGDYDIASLSVALLIWARVHGIVSLEVSQSLPPFGVDGNGLYLYELRSIERQFIKE